MKNFRKWILRLMPVLAVLMVAGLILSRVYRPESRDAEPDLRITAFDAAAHIGERAVVCGIVESADFRPDIGGEPTFLNLGRPHPDQPFTVVIWGEDRGRWSVPPDQRYLTRRICVTGTIREHRGTPQIRVREPRQIRED
jgi:hypothetical protein